MTVMRKAPNVRISPMQAAALFIGTQDLFSIFLSAAREIEGQMVTAVVYCLHCGSENIVRNGKAPNGKQKYRCKECKKQSRENSTPHAYTEERREEIFRAYQERSSLRGIERTFGVSRTSVIAWMKKKQKSCQH